MASVSPESTAVERGGWQAQRVTLVLNGLFAVRVLLSLGFYVLVARRFGTSAELDAYWLAVTPSLILVNLSEAAGVAASINYFTTIAHLGEDEQRSEVAGFIYAWLCAGALIALGLVLGAREAAALLGPGLSDAGREQTTVLLRWASLAILAAPASILGAVGILRVSDRFVAAAVIALVPPAVQITALVGGVRTVSGLAATFGAAYVGTAVFALAQLHLARHPAWLSPTFSHRRLLLAQLPPFIIAELLVQSVYLRERSLASLMGTGSVSALALGLRLVGALGAFVSAGVEHTLAPAVARLHSAGNHSLARRSVIRGLAVVAAFTIGPGIALLVAPRLWVRLAFYRGAFDQLSVTLTSTVVAGYFGVYVFNSIGRVLIAATMSRRRARDCVIINVAILGIYMLLAPWLASAYGLRGLALSTSSVLLLGTALYGLRVW
jgi:putative peptidoglycan lipid II flippase